MRLAKYTKTPINYFLDLPLDEFHEWIKITNAEIKRESKEIEKIKAKQNRHRR